MVTNNFSAEQGRNMGAQVSIVTKSGTNQFHGSLWDYHTNNVLQIPQHLRHHAERSGQPAQPVRLRRGRPHHSQQDILLHNLRRRPARRRHRLHRNRRDAAAAQLGAAEPARITIAAYFMKKLPPGGRPHHQRPRRRLSAARRQQIQLDARRHSRYRHGPIPDHHRCPLQPVHHPRRSRTAARQGPPVRLLLPAECAHHHPRHPPRFPASQPHLGHLRQPGLFPHHQPHGAQRSALGGDALHRALLRAQGSQGPDRRRD